MLKKYFRLTLIYDKPFNTESNSRAHSPDWSFYRGRSLLLIYLVNLPIATNVHNLSQIKHPRAVHMWAFPSIPTEPAKRSNCGATAGLAMNVDDVAYIWPIISGRESENSDTLRFSDAW